MWVNSMYLGPKLDPRYILYAYMDPLGKALLGVEHVFAIDLQQGSVFLAQPQGSVG